MVFLRGPRTSETISMLREVFSCMREVSTHIQVEFPVQDVPIVALIYSSIVVTHNIVDGIHKGKTFGTWILLILVRVGASRRQNHDLGRFEGLLVIIWRLSKISKGLNALSLILRVSTGQSEVLVFLSCFWLGGQQLLPQQASCTLVSTLRRVIKRFPFVHCQLNTSRCELRARLHLQQLFLS